MIHLSSLSKKIHSAPEYNYVRRLITVSWIKFGLNYSNIDFSLLLERERERERIGNIIISSISQGERPAGGDGGDGGVMCE